MIVLPVGIRLFILSVFSAELVPHYKLAFHQQIEGIVDGRTAHAGVVFRETCCQFIRVKMPIGVINGIQYSENARVSGADDDPRESA